MARLNNLEITNIILAKGYKVIDITGYQNKDSRIMVQCPKGHYVSTSLSSLEKPTFKCPSCMGALKNIAVSSDSVPIKNGYRIIGFDQSSNKIGVSIYDNGKLVYYDLYQLNGELDERLMKWGGLVKTAAKDWQADFIMFEDIQYQVQAGPLTFKTLAQVLGVGIAAAEECRIKHSQVLNKVWQAEFSIGGSTRAAQKANVISRVKEYFSLDVTDDVGDAILIGLYAADQLKHNWEQKIF